MPGKVCLTFDDCYLDTWSAALPLLESYGARATFYVSYFLLTVDSAGVAFLLDAQKRGHEIGCHSVHHHDPRKFLAVYTENEYVATEVHPTLRAMQACGLRCPSWAYPYNQSTPGLVRRLAASFASQRVRALEPDQALATPGDTVLYGLSIDTVVPGAAQQLLPVEPILGLLARAAATDRIAVLYGHDIIPEAQAGLTTIISRARDLGLEFVTASEIAGMTAR